MEGFVKHLAMNNPTPELSESMVRSRKSKLLEEDIEYSRISGAQFYSSMGGPLSAIFAVVPGVRPVGQMSGFRVGGASCSSLQWRAGFAGMCFHVASG